MYIDLMEEALKQAISNPRKMQKFILAAIPCLSELSEGSIRVAENHTNDGRYLLSYALSLYFNSLFIIIFFVSS